MTLMIDEYSTYVGELVCRRHPAVPGDVVHQLRGELDVDNGLELQVLLALFLSTVVNLTRHTRILLEMNHVILPCSRSDYNKRKTF